MPPEQQIPTTYLGLFVFLMTSMWGLIAIMVRALLKNQSETAKNQVALAKEVSNHMATSNEILRMIAAEQARVQVQSGPLIEQFVRVSSDISETKGKLLDTIIELARASGAAQAVRAFERNSERMTRESSQPVKITEQPVKVEDVTKQGENT